MALGKKDFEAVAAVIRRRVGDYSAPGQEVVKGIAHGLADEFARSNPRFDRSRFLVACGVEGSTVK